MERNNQSILKCLMVETIQCVVHIVPYSSNTECRYGVEWRTGGEAAKPCAQLRAQDRSYGEKRVIRQ